LYRDPLFQCLTKYYTQCLTKCPSKCRTSPLDTCDLSGYFPIGVCRFLHL